MTEKSKLSISFRVDDGVIEHNNRNFLPRNVDPARTCDNITYKSENLKEVYHRLFDKALEEYNSKKRSNEKIADYYEHIKKRQTGKTVFRGRGSIRRCRKLRLKIGQLGIGERNA